jgi:periplasmic glucans biosynthesis protein
MILKREGSGLHAACILPWIEGAPLVRRRDFLKVLGSLSAATLLPAGRRLEAASPAPETSKGLAFSAGDVQKQARALAAEKFVPPKIDLPKPLQDIGYDQYHEIRFKRERALWTAEGLPFLMELFHRGFIFKEPVAVHIVADGTARRVVYSPDFFIFGPSVTLPPEGTVTDFSGFRILAPVNRPDGFDEFVVFQGASYFRAVAKGQGYGLSARGLALNTGAREGEEFPFFRAFWIERPQAEARTIVVHALLDSISTTGAYRFTIRPSDATVMDVEMTLYPRVELKLAGLAPLTSMFVFGPNDRVGIDDVRTAVHDSDGLSIWNGRGEWLWRPLTHPETLQISEFIDDNPRGFGLLQRHRSFADYQDLDAHYERRPSLWIEPIGYWGGGAVQLVEIPSKTEYHDNVVVFWRPSQPIPAQSEERRTYRLHWCWTPPVTPQLATTADTRVGAGLEKGTRFFVIDFVGGRLADLPPDAPVQMAITTSAGTVKQVAPRPNPAVSGWRASFVLDPAGAKLCDMRGILKLGEEPLAEIWSYRWTP